MKTTRQKSAKRNRNQSQTQPGPNGNQPHQTKKRTGSQFNPSQAATAAASTKLNEAELASRFSKKVPLIKVWDKQWHRYTEYWEPIERKIYKKNCAAIDS
jgi:hypothetical protein